MQLIIGVVLGATACGPNEPREPDLPRQPDRWVISLVLDSASKAKYIGKTRDLLITTSTTIRGVDGLRSVSVGDQIEGIPIGAIRCSFHSRDATYGGEQFMWRGRWACVAGRNRNEVENAVSPNGEKRFEFIHISPVRLGDN